LISTLAARLHDDLILLQLFIPLLLRPLRKFADGTSVYRDNEAAGEADWLARADIAVKASCLGLKHVRGLDDDRCACQSLDIHASTPISPGTGPLFQAERQEVRP
jgi:hypothetical protein